MSPVRLPRPAVRGIRGVCACGHPLGAAAAAEIIAAGGSAVDSALAAAAALSVVLPDACGLGGDALLLLSMPDGQELAFNGSGRSPRALKGAIPADGGGTVAVPGAVAAWTDAHRRFGRLELARVLAPAVTLAAEGFPLGEETARALSRQRHRLERTASSFPLLTGGIEPGSRVRFPELALTLRRIGTEGAESLYTGELARAIANAARRDGGALDEGDLAEHETDVLSPISARRLDHSLIVQPPVSQATLALTALAAVERGGASDPAQRLHIAVEAWEAAFSFRHLLTEPAAAMDLVDAPLSVDPERAARRRGARSDAHTTAVATADDQGTVVSMLISVFDDFGSAVLVPEGGFLLNDRLHGFTAPGCEPRPATRPIHTLSPAIAATEHKRFALCTPGSDGQVQFLVQALLALSDGDSLPVAFDRPRVRSVDGRLAVEHDMDSAIVEHLRSRGHDLWLRPPGEGRFGAMVTAGVDNRTGTLFAGADPRRETWAIGV
jgi:gamma-glutamyltranspeptidase / glutathione hydrolase